MDIVNSSYWYIGRSVGATVGRGNNGEIYIDIDAKYGIGYGEGYW